jgi:DNA-binding response OmpR family regulator
MILIVDDEPSILGLIKLVLATEGISSVTAASVDEGCDLLRQRKDIDLMLLDWRLDRSGIEVLRVCRELFPLMPVIVMSAMDLNVFSVKEDALMAEADSFLEKPLSPPVLVKHVKRWLRRVETAANPLQREDDIICSKN